MTAPDDRLDAAHAARAICAALGELMEEPLAVRISTAASRARVCDARVARLIAIGELVDAATIGADGEVRVAGRYVYEARTMLNLLRAVQP